MDLKRFSETSPILGAFLIFIGYLRIDLYYSYWNVHIYNYLDFSEIMLSFLNDSNTLLFFCLLLLLQMTVGIGTITLLDDWKNKKVSLPVESNNPVTKGKTIKLILTESYKQKPEKTALFLFIIFLISVFVFLYFNNLLTLYFSSITLIQFLLIFFDKIVKLKNVKDCVQISIILTLLGFVWGLSEYNIKKTEMRPIKVDIYTKEDVIITNSELLFIGKTSNYYILFDKRAHKSLIIKDSEVDKSVTDASY